MEISTSEPKTRRPRLGVDLDGCVYDWAGCYRFLARHCLGVEMPSIEEVWTALQAEKSYLSEKERRWMWEEGVERGLFRHGHLIKGAAEGLRTLSEWFDLVIVSHRPHAIEFEISPNARRTAILDTLSWLAHLRLPFSEVHLLNHSQPKSSVHCEIYVDDSPSVVYDLLQNTESVVILFGQPWNRQMFIPNGSRLVRVETWEELLSIVPYGFTV